MLSRRHLWGSGNRTTDKHTAASNANQNTIHDSGNDSSASLNKGNVVFTFSIDINQKYIWLQLLVNSKLFHKSCLSNLKQWSTIRVYIIILFSRRKIVNMHLPTYKDVAPVSALAWEKNVPTVSKILIHKALKKTNFRIFERFSSAKKIIM